MSGHIRGVVIPALSAMLAMSHPAVATSPDPATSPEPAASSAPVASATPSAASSPLEFHLDPVLEAALPVLVDGQQVFVESIPAAAYLSVMDPASDAARTLRRFLAEVGSDPETITMAFGGWGADDAGGAFQAFRAPGAQPERLLAATVYLMRSATGDSAAATVGTELMGSRTVSTITAAGAAPMVIRVVVLGDIAIASAAPRASLEALLEALP